MDRLINDENLLDLDFLDFDTCVDCIKGKLTTKIRNTKDERCIELLEVIHTNVCGSFTPPVMGGHKYFIMFIDNHSCYSFVELIREKSDFLEVFKAFKAKVELQQGKKIKVVQQGKKIKVIHSDIVGEYCGRYDEMRRNFGPFAKYLQECGIDAQYTMFGTPQQNGIKERRNRTLLDMV